MLRSIGNQFKRPTGLLGKIISKVMMKGNMPDYLKLIPELDIKQHDIVLEIGYGHGLGVNMILSKYDCTVSGIDFSELMFKQASKRNKKFIESGKLELKCGNFLESEMSPDQFDKIFCIHVIYFWDDLAKPFTKIKTALKEHGMFCIFMANVDFIKKMKFTKDGIFNKYSKDEVVDALYKVGFKEVSYSLNSKGYIIKCC
ncbi:MAG: class I SAM-dependent methyltransferase [Bacteroidetes bacterium]|nr:class I SAM-dependent methyltransferase [Bacteroidota bacterium]